MAIAAPQYDQVALQALPDQLGLLFNPIFPFEDRSFRAGQEEMAEALLEAGKIPVLGPKSLPGHREIPTPVADRIVKSGIDGVVEDGHFDRLFHWSVLGPGKIIGLSIHCQKATEPHT
jgi:hypothetical protein